MIMLAYLILTVIILVLQVFQKKHLALSILGVIHSSGSLLITLILVLTPENWQDTSGIFLVDHASVLMVFITGMVFTCASVFAVGYIDGLVRDGELDRRSLRIFYAGFSILLIVTTLAFYSPNIAQFWICAELTTAISALLVAVLAVRENIDASLKYIFISSSSMLFSFIGVIFLFELVRQSTGAISLDWKTLLAIAPSVDSGMLWIAFGFFFIGFAAKSGIVPLHTWLPEAHAKAPSAVSAVLSGVILNIGIYGILRLTGIVSHSTVSFQSGTILIIFGVLSMSIAALSMLCQTGTKRLIAFSSVENMGFILLGIGLMTPLAIFWTLFHMIGHSLVKSGLFLSAGILNRQYHPETPGDDEKPRDLISMQPFATRTLGIGMIAIIGTPGFPLFISKIGILIAAGQKSMILALIILIFFAIAASALLRYFIRLISLRYGSGGRPKQYVPPVTMKIPIIILIAASIIAGLWIIPGEEAFLTAAVADIGMGGV